MWDFSGVQKACFGFLDIFMREFVVPIVILPSLLLMFCLHFFSFVVWRLCCGLFGFLSCSFVSSVVWVVTQKGRKQDD